MDNMVYFDDQLKTLQWRINRLEEFNTDYETRISSEIDALRYTRDYFIKDASQKIIYKYKFDIQMNNEDIMELKREVEEVKEQKQNEIIKRREAIMLPSRSNGSNACTYPQSIPDDVLRMILLDQRNLP